MVDNSEDLEPMSEGVKRTISRAEEVVRKRESDLSKFVTPLKPSHETQLFLDREARFLSEKARKLLQSQAYFYERSTDTLIESNKNERPEVLLDEDKEEINRALEWLELDWSDYLDPNEELQAGKEVIKSLRDTMDIMRENNQPAFITWFNLAKRITEFQTNIISDEAKDSVEQQRILLLNSNLQNYILSRVPLLLKPSAVQGKLSKVIDAVESNKSQEEIESYYDELDEYMEENYYYGILELDFPRSEGLKWRNTLKNLVVEKGTSKGVLTGSGKKIVLEGDEVEQKFGTQRVEIWFPGEEHPVHITADLPYGIEPRYVKIDENGVVETSIQYYRDDPESIRGSEDTKNITKDKWETFIESVIEQTEKYTPS